MGLFPIPGTTIGGAQVGDYLLKSLKARHVVPCRDIERCQVVEAMPGGDFVEWQCLDKRGRDACTVNQFDGKVGGILVHQHPFDCGGDFAAVDL